MASSTSTLARQNGLLLLPAIAKLARWRFKQMWRFLLVTWLGMLAMVVLACAPPLFSRVAISADLRAVVANAPDGQDLIVQVISLSPTTTQVQQVSQRLNRLLEQGSLGAYLQGTSQLVVQTPPLATSRSNNGSANLVLDGYDPAQAAQLIAHGLAPQDPRESGIFVSLPPGAFTAILAGKSGGTGIGLLEIYNLQ